MKIGFDIHGVIDESPKMFKEIIDMLREKGHEIHILTGSVIDDKITKQLSDYGIKYDFIFSILDYHKAVGTKMWQNESGWWVDDTVWNKTKAIYINEHNLDFHIDDTKIYGDYFNDTIFGHLTPKTNNPRVLEVSNSDNNLNKIYDIFNIFICHKVVVKIIF